MNRHKLKKLWKMKKSHKIGNKKQVKIAIIGKFIIDKSIGIGKLVHL